MLRGSGDLKGPQENASPSPVTPAKHWNKLQWIIRLREQGMGQNYKSQKFVGSNCTQSLQSKSGTEQVSFSEKGRGRSSLQKHQISTKYDVGNLASPLHMYQRSVRDAHGGGNFQNLSSTDPMHPVVITNIVLAEKCPFISFSLERTCTQLTNKNSKAGKDVVIYGSMWRF